MENQSYYLHRMQSTDDICSTEVPLQVNCAGYVNMSRAFVTNGRRHDWYLQLIDDGSLTTAGTVMTPGQFIVRPPEKPFRYELKNDGSIGYYWVHFTGSWAEGLLSSAGIGSDRIYTISDDRMQSLRRDFGMLFREFMLRRQGYREMSASFLTSLVVRLGRAVAADSTESESNGLRKRLEHSAAYIHSHYTENLTVTELAAMEHLSESRFRDIFREAFGAPPGDYIINLRLSHACELLLTTDLNISETAEICGYSDVLYFCRLFRRKMGVTPAAYRKNAVQNQTGENAI
ncbi:MAG: helix-turn-helix transcriptional regulator [Clostridia bacterium]|nr:helix-turn-helix transcriptional regulator [Clostridia bacterium]MBQ8513632.1 helix-turn-helix transcriptional regulator [Clostridia bacterium]